jgi:hypothetical protein
MLALEEYLMGETLPLATIHEAILDFCRGRTDLCVFGAQALSVHTGVPRMTQNVDIMADNPEETARELVTHLANRFNGQMAARVRRVSRGERVLGYRVYQKRSADQGGNRHLADIRILDVPRASLEIRDGIQFTGPALTLAMKTFAATVRSNPIKRDQDRVDVQRLLVAMPGTTASELEPLWAAMNAPLSAVRRTYEELRSRAASTEPDDDDDDDFY